MATLDMQTGEKALWNMAKNLERFKHASRCHMISQLSPAAIRLLRQYGKKHPHMAVLVNYNLSFMDDTTLPDGAKSLLFLEYSNLCAASRIVKTSEMARYCLDQCYKGYKEIKELFSPGLCLQIGVRYKELLRFQNATDVLKSATLKFENSHQPQWRAVCYYNLADLYLRMLKPESSIVCSEMCLEYFEERGLKAECCFVSNLVAQGYMCKGDCEFAIAILIRNITTYADNPTLILTDTYCFRDSSPIYQTYGTLSICYYLMAQYAEAMYYRATMLRSLCYVTDELSKKQNETVCYMGMGLILLKKAIKLKGELNYNVNEFDLTLKGAFLHLNKCTLKQKCQSTGKIMYESENVLKWLAAVVFLKGHEERAVEYIKKYMDEIIHNATEHLPYCNCCQDTSFVLLQCGGCKTVRYFTCRVFVCT